MPTIQVHPAPDEERSESRSSCQVEEKEEDASQTCTIMRVFEVAIAFIIGIFSVACIMMGFIYINFCAMEQISFLTIWLILQGVIVLSTMLATMLWLDQKKKPEVTRVTGTGPFILTLVLIFFSVIWLLIGNIVIWSWWSNEWKESHPCHAPLLTFAVAATIVYNSLLMLLCLMGLVLTLDESRQSSTERPQQEYVEMTLCQQLRSLFYPSNKKMSWQSCIGYSALLMYGTLAVSTIVAGSIYEYRCPNTKMPLWLLVQGISTAFLIIIFFTCHTFSQDFTKSTRVFVLCFFPATVFTIYQIAWLAIGNEWAFHYGRREKMKSTDIKGARQHQKLFEICDEVLYVFYSSVIALLDIPVMIVVVTSIAMTFALILYSVSPCFPDHLCSEETPPDETEEEPDQEEEEKDDKKPNISVTINMAKINDDASAA